MTENKNNDAKRGITGLKIVVYSHNLHDLIGCYADLTADHDVHVRYLGHLFEGYDRQTLWSHGFRNENIREIDRNHDPVNDVADAYFLHDLDESCLIFLRRLPKNMAFVVRGSPFINEETVRSGGYNVIERKSIKETVERLGRRIGEDE